MLNFNTLRQIGRKLIFPQLLWRLGYKYIYIRIYFAKIMPTFNFLILGLIVTRESFSIANLSYSKNRTPASMIFYNAFGRVLFFWQQRLLSYTFPRRRSRPILVETHDEIDYPSLYAEGWDSTMWPPPASVDMRFENAPVSAELAERIDQSYKLAYEHDTKRFANSDWWESNRAAFQKSLFDEAGRIKPDVIEQFRALDTGPSCIIQDQRKLILAGGSFHKAYRAGLNVVMRYHRYSPHCNLELLRSVSEPFVGGSKCTVYRGQRLSIRLVTHAYYLSQITSLVEFKIDDPITILDIGGSYGGLGRLLLNHYPKAKFVLIELPEVASFAAHYLTAALPDRRVGLLSDVGVDTIKAGKLPLDDFDVLVLPTWCAEFLPDNFSDLTINTTSLGEMSLDYGSFYVSQIERTTRGYFYSANGSVNNTHNFGNFGFYNWTFGKRWSPISYRKTPSGHFQYLGRRVD